MDDPIMTIKLRRSAVATVAGLVAEDDELREIIDFEDGPASEAITALNSVWDEIRREFPLELFKEHGDWNGKDEDDALSCPSCSSTNIRTYIAEPDHGYCLRCGLRFKK